MKPLEKDELYQNLQGFLQAKGVELKDGSYTKTIQKSCALLADAINAGQQGLSRAKVEVDKKLDQLRRVIHEKTAPKTTSAPPPNSTNSPPKAPRPRVARKGSRPRRRSTPRKKP